MLLAHLSDQHLRPPGELYQGLVDSNGMFDAAIRHLNTLDPPPDLVIITGDIVDQGTPAEYDHARTALSAIQQPVLKLPVIVTLVTSFKSPAEIARNPSF